MLMRRSVILAALLLSAASARGARAPQIQGGESYLGITSSSRPDGPESRLAGLQITNVVKGPNGTTFEGDYADQFGIDIPVQGKLTNKRKFTFEGEGPDADPGSLFSIKFTGQMSASGDLFAGTYKSVYKNFSGAPTNPFKDYGGAYFEAQ
jgi:hypothetical protein